MPQAKVRHALVTYTANKDGKEQIEHAFRGEVIDVYEGEYNRLLELGALVAPDTELDAPGMLYRLPESATDEEVHQWVREATDSEIRKLVAERPELAERVAGHVMRIKEDRRRSNELLGLKENRIIDALDGAEVPEFDAEGRPTRADEGTSAGLQQGVGGSANVPHDAELVDDTQTDEATGEEVEDDTDPDQIVQRNAREVAEWISRNPRRASDVLEAENRLAATGANNGQPRKTIVMAVEAAAGFTQ